MMTSRFAVGSVSTLAMGALLLGTASLWLNRGGSGTHATPWGDISSLSPGAAAASQTDDKAQLLKLAALKAGTDPAPAAAAPSAPPPAVDTAAAVPAPQPASPTPAEITPPPPAAAAPADQPLQTAMVEDPAPATAATQAAPAASVNLIDLNTASADALDHIPGVGRVGRSIVAHRPYHSVKDLVSKRVLRTSDYQKIESHVRVD